MNKYLVELIGTFFLVLTVASTALLNAGSPLAPIAIGSALMVMIYAGGHISGGHYNPAVSLGALLRGRLGAKDIIPYIVAQLIGAVLAVIAAKTLFPEQANSIAIAIEASKSTIPAATPALLPIFLAEFLFTFALVYVVLNVATAKGNTGTGFYGLAIGFTVLVGAITVGSISGGAFNPAVALGVALVAKPGVVLTFSLIWIYLLAQFLAGAIAGLLFRALNPNDK